MSDDDTNALRSIDYEALRNLSTGAIDGCIDVLTLTEARLRMIKFPVILIMESLRAVMGVASLVKPQDNQFLLFEPFGTNVWIGLVPLVALLALLGKARPSKRLLLFFLSCSSFFCHLCHLTRSRLSDHSTSSGIKNNPCKQQIDSHSPSGKKLCHLQKI